MHSFINFWEVCIFLFKVSLLALDQSDLCFFFEFSIDIILLRKLIIEHFLLIFHNSIWIPNRNKKVLSWNLYRRRIVFYFHRLDDWNIWSEYHRNCGGWKNINYKGNKDDRKTLACFCRISWFLLISQWDRGWEKVYML